MVTKPPGSLLLRRFGENKRALQKTFKKKPMQITRNNYQKILQKVQGSIEQAKNKIIRDKVELSWQVGKIIEENLPKNQQEKYGKELIKKLGQDTLIGPNVLYKMHGFYKAYPKLPKNDSRLNWSHYRVLSGVKKSGERRILEDLTKKDSLDSDELQKEVTKLKALPSKHSKAVKITKKKITPQRGKLFSYQIKKIAGSTKYFLDCGFGVFREVVEALPNALRNEEQIVGITKNDSGYSIKKLVTTSQQLHVYVAYLERVVDGDTIRVNLDLGFGIFHHEILRLAKINAAEMSTNEGKKSKKALEKILKDLRFLIVKSIKTDIYGRYVADIFFAENKKESDPKKVADTGVYLNQLLLDRKLAELF